MVSSKDGAIAASPSKTLSNNRIIGLFFVALTILCHSTPVLSLVLKLPQQLSVGLSRTNERCSRPLYMAAPPNSDIQSQLEKAKALIEASKAKLAKKESDAQQQADDEAPQNGEAKGKSVPFFASKSSSTDKKIKSRDEKTGLITADGEKMAELSESEAWESRSLLDVFVNERNVNEDVYSKTSQQLAERDVAASIYNLRKQLQSEDYRKIFDKRNRFIGEDN